MEGFGHRFDHRLEQITQHGVVASLDLDRGGHARLQLDLFLWPALEGLTLGADTRPVVRLLVGSH